jgi:hypothetical protein
MRDRPRLTPPGDVLELVQRLAADVQELRRLEDEDREDD